MHQTLEIYLQKKKRVPEFYNPDSYRIFDDAITDQSLGDSKLNKLYLEYKKETPPPHPRDPERRNCPQPYYSRFLTANARTLNKPISIIHSDDEHSHWWPTSMPDDDKKLPPVTKNTTQRSDYVDYCPIKRRLQHAKDIVSSAKGILPVNPFKNENDPGEHLLEKISFHHQYNSRAKEIMQRRGRLHGCFVWDRVVKDSKGRDIIETAWNRGELERERNLTVALARNTHTQTAETQQNQERTTETKSIQNQEPAGPQEATNNDNSIQKTFSSPNKQDSKVSIPPIEGLPPP